MLTRVLAAVVALLAVALGVQTLRMQRAHAALAEHRAQAAQALTDAVTAARAEEQRRVAAHQEVARAAHSATVRARADAAAARSAADRLREYAAGLAAAAACDPAPAAAGASAAGPGLLLAELLGRADQRAGVLAEYADQARIAGLACERAYDALTQAAPPP